MKTFECKTNDDNDDDYKTFATIKHHPFKWQRLEPNKTSKWAANNSFSYKFFQLQLRVFKMESNQPVHIKDG